MAMSSKRQILDLNLYVGCPNYQIDDNGYIVLPSLIRLLSADSVIRIRGSRDIIRIFLLSGLLADSYQLICGWREGARTWDNNISWLTVNISHDNKSINY